jgi:hypothetical protein
MTIPKGTCEKINTEHVFKIKFGKCTVTRDVKITHCITANLNHHITENIICKHSPCTKNTCEEINTSQDGKHCKVPFPDRDDDIIFIDDSIDDNSSSNHHNHNHHDNHDNHHHNHHSGHNHNHNHGSQRPRRHRIDCKKTKKDNDFPF